MIGIVLTRRISQMPEKNKNACEMDHAKEILQVVFPAYRKTAEVLEPSEEAFYLPTPPGGVARGVDPGCGGFGCSDGEQSSRLRSRPDPDRAGRNRKRCPR